MVDADASHREAAQLKMAELNAAWEVLRDPKRRAELDQRRAGSPGRAVPGGDAPTNTGRERAGAEGAAPAPTWSAGSAPGGVPLLEPELEDAPTVVARRPGWQAHPVEVIVVVLVLLVVVVALAATGSQQDPEGVDTTERFAPGSCVQVTPTPGLVEATCDQPGAVVVLGSEPFPRPCPAGSQAVVLLEEQRSVCIQAPAP